MKRIFIPAVISGILVVLFVVVNILVFLAVEVANGNAIADAIKYTIALFSVLTCFASIVVVWLAWWFVGVVEKRIKDEKA